MRNMRGIGRGLATAAGIAAGAAIFWAGGNSPAQAQGACVCPAGFTPIVIQNPASPLFNNRPDHMACSAGPGVQQACGSSPSNSRQDVLEKLSQPGPRTPRVTPYRPLGSDIYEFEEEGMARKAKQTAGKFGYYMDVQEISDSIHVRQPGLFEQIEQAEAADPFLKERNKQIREVQLEILRQMNADLSNRPPLPPLPDPPRPRHLGMTITPTVLPEVGAAGGAAVIHNNGSALTDNAGLLVPNTSSLGFRSIVAGGGVKVNFDASPLFNLSRNQSIKVGAFFHFEEGRTESGAASGLLTGISNRISDRFDNTTSGVLLRYGIDNWYIKDRVAVHWGQGRRTDHTTVADGNFDTHGFTNEFLVGRVFPLFGAVSNTSSLPTKGPRTPLGGYIVELDLSGRLGYNNRQADQFIDTAGFVYGEEKIEFWNIGGRAKLSATVLNGAMLWMPYVGVTYDKLTGFSHTAQFPAQVGLPADTLFFHDAKSFLGVEGGVEVFSFYGVDVKTTGFYRASSDVSIAGGRVTATFAFRPPR